MRHEKAEILLKIAIDMQGQRMGLSLADIATRYSDSPLSRRTAERLRDALIRLFPGRVEEVATDQPVKRWRLRSQWLRGLSDLDEETLTSLDTAGQLLETAGLSNHLTKITALKATLVSLIETEAQTQLEGDVQGPDRTEMVAIRPGPRVRFSTSVLAVLREAIKLRKVVRVGYRYRKTNILRSYDLHPCGLLYGHRHYLVASRTPGSLPKYFILGRIETAEILAFTAIRPEGFSLSRHVERSFGLWQEEPIDIHWRFSADVAEEAAEFIFHPTQRMVKGEDGTLDVFFRAGGIIEMDWHLYTWGDAVSLISPKPEQWRELVRKSLESTKGGVAP